MEGLWNKWIRSTAGWCFHLPNVQKTKRSNDRLQQIQTKPHIQEERTAQTTVQSTEPFEPIKSNEWRDFIDAFIYINLASRTDRNQEMLDELYRVGVPVEKIHRLDATTGGLVGCSTSHANALALYLSHPEWQHVLILEDDFDFMQDIHLLDQQLDAFIQQYIDKYDAVLLAHCVRTAEPVEQMQTVVGSGVNPSLIRLRKATNAAGYLLNRSTARALESKIRAHLEPLRLTQAHWIHSIDVVWWDLMQTGTWYGFEPRLGSQRPSYSDLSNTFVERR